MGRKLILLCEDDEDQALLAQDALDEEYALDISTLGQAVLEKNLDDYAVILLDYNLPDISGLEILQEVVQRTSVPAIMLTGENDIHLAVEALKIGAYNYLVKGPNAYTALPIVVQRTIEEHNQKRKTQELELLLFQKEKMTAIGQLAAGTSHEIFNPLTFITGNLTFIKEYSQELESAITDFLHELQHDPLPQAKVYLEKFEKLHGGNTPISILGELKHSVDDSMEGAERIRKIVQGLVDFSNVQRSELKVVNLNDCLNNTLQILRHEFTQQIEIIAEYGELPSITAYAGQLNQVFMHILMNASQAVNEKGEIRIKTYQKDDEIYIEISDTGCGIPKENLTHLFEPFFTTQSPGRGAGMGLSVSYGIIKRQGGKIEVKSKVGVGTKFTIRLPIQLPAQSERAEN